MKFSAKILFCILYAISISFVFGQASVQAKETKNTSNNYSFLLENPNKINEFLEQLNIKDEKVTIIREIGLIYIESNKNNVDLKKELTPYRKKIENYISVEGELPKLEVTLDKPNVNNVNEKIPDTKNPPLTSPMFKPFNFYLEDVTNNYQSYFINKGEHTTIALIDSGIDQTHPLLKNNINFKKGKNYTSDKLDYDDEMGHGTSVAGVLVSIAPDTTIVPYKVLGEESGESIWVLKAIVDATNDGNDILNLSLGTYKMKSNKEEKLLIKAYEKATQYANKHGALVVSAAGNASKDLDKSKKSGEIYLPGSLKNVISVSSNTNQDTLSSYSNYGKAIDFSAPGGYLDENYDVTGLILTTFPVNKPNNIVDQLIGVPAGYTLTYGTSLSAPQVSAAAALIISEYNKYNKKKPKINKIVKYLKKGSIDLGTTGYDTYFGYGKINIYQSLINIK